MKLIDSLMALYVVLAIAGLVGWCMNLWKLCSMSFDHVTGLMVGRGIGVVLAPVGAVLGYF